VSEDLDKTTPEAEAAQREDDVEAHRAYPAAAEDKVIAATEEGPDVEAHKVQPKTTP
jgi:hypothetical protein